MSNGYISVSIKGIYQITVSVFKNFFILKMFFKPISLSQLRLWYGIAKNHFKPFLKNSLNGLIVLQLTIYPYITKAQELDQKQTNYLNQAHSFNQNHVESLRDFIFNSAEQSKAYYKNHPLDTFSLLGQKVFNKKSRTEERKVKKFLEFIINNKEKFLVRGVEKSNELNESKELKTIKLSKIHDFIREVKDLYDLSYSDYDKKYEQKFYQRVNQILDQSVNEEFISNIIPKKKIPEKHKLLNRKIPHDYLVVEIFEEADWERQNILEAVLSHPSQKPLIPKVLPSKKQEHFTGSVFHTKDQKNFSFRFNYHEFSMVHSFPNHIQWMAFFGPYLIFLEPSKVTNEKALISFIDLKYFEKAIGKTSLPIFYIPVHFTKELARESIIYPEHIDITDGFLNLGEISISSEQIDYISKLQKLNFNTTVSLIDPANTDMSKEFLKEIVNNFENSILKEDKLEHNSSHFINIKQHTKELVLKLLENRKQIGSFQDPSGNYKKLKKVENSLSTLENEKLVREFKNSLQADEQFQQSVLNIHEASTKKQKFLRRWMLFLNHLTRPQPLGSPKIEKALGLIANSVLPGETVKSRWMQFKEGISQFFYIQENRYLSLGVLTGAGMIAHPELAKYFIVALDSMGSWLYNWSDLISITTEASFRWASTEGLYKAYFEGDKPIFLAKGISALFSVFLIFIGTIHLGTNLHSIAKNINSKEVLDHRGKVRDFFAKMKNFSLIEYMEAKRLDFIESLSNAEKMKLGLILDVQMGLQDIKTRQILKTSSPLHTIQNALESDKEISLEIEATDPEKGNITLNLKAEPHSYNSPIEENQIKLSFSHSNKFIERVFTVSDGNLKNLIKEENIEFNHNLSLKTTLSGENLHIEGSLENADFSREDNEKLIEILAKIEESSGEDYINLEEALPGKKIKTLRKALLHLFVGYSSWAETFRFTGTAWNWFFFSRNIYIKPITAVRLLYYSKYFKVNVHDKHRETVFNGGKQRRWSRWGTILKSKTEKQISVKKSFKSIKEFENKIIDIEKQVLSAVKAQAYLATIQFVGEQKSEEGMEFLSQASISLNPNHIKNKKTKIFYSIYVKELFHEVMKDYFSNLINKNSLGDNELKSEMFLQFLSENDNLLPKKVDKHELEKMINRVAEEHNIFQKSHTAVNQLVKGFLKRMITTREQAGRNALNPKHSLTMDRMDVAKRLLNEPEALARATRQQLTDFYVDKPIELLFTFLFLAGVDQGILKILHDEAFTEEAWFHLSRYAIWSIVFSSVILDTLAGVWMKVQMDDRLDKTKGFEIVPDKKDVEKRFGYIRWLKKQFFAEDNTLFENYKYSWKIILANIPAAAITYSIIYFSTLGRFDLDAFLSGYLILTFPLMALGFKMENTFEKSANWSLKKLIKEGLDLNEEHRRFLSHPFVQNMKIKEGGKLRGKFNVWLAFLYNNPMENIAQVFGNIDSPLGSRAFSRMFFGGHLATEYWVNFMDFLDNKNIISAEFAEKCKSIFTNNRTDL